MISAKKEVLSPKLNLLLYSLLLILFPLLLLQNFMQEIIGTLSSLTFGFMGIEVPYIVAIALLIFTVFLVAAKKTLNKRQLISWAIALFLWFLGQQITDYYLNNSFYDLQNNWHYLAYGLFAFIAYNSLSKNQKSTSSLILNIFIWAFIISAFDETLQIFLSNRVFDISDIAKDLLGTIAGIIVIFIGYKNPEIIKNGWKIRENKIKDYFNNPLSTIVFLGIFTFILLFVSSNLTDSKYVMHILLITLLLFLVIFLLVHNTRTKKGRWMVALGFAILFAIQVFSFIKNYNNNITYHKSGITLYKGIPLLYFDVMIFENGSFRYVDKKTTFNNADISFFNEKASNILLIGSEENNKDRLGFPMAITSQFIYNLKQKKPVQVIILPSSQACKVYNRLKNEGKAVTFIIHNTK